MISTTTSTAARPPVAHAEAGTLKPNRLLSLDFMRGLIMVLLALESTGLYENLINGTTGTTHSLLQQFQHHPWHGLHAWDLVQPAFMFMAGAAMAFSLNRQLKEGRSWSYSFRKALRRSGWLFFWGVLDYAVRPGGLSFELWDVLTQLSFTSLLAFLIFRWSERAQVTVCAGLLLLTEVLYRFMHVPDFNQPFADQHNFGNYIDWILMRKINPGGWVAINCIPTAVHTIGGALAGKLLLGKSTSKARTLVVWGIAALVLGYALDWANITPIIKRIATSSFVLVSLGYSLLILAICYWWIDIRDHRRHLEFFTIVGMNSIFLYLFFEIVGDRWFTGYITFIANGVMTPLRMPGLLQAVVASLCVFGLEWGLCWFLWKKRIFFKV